MEIAVFDTYVKKTDGKIMHFDVIVPAGANPEDVYKFGREYLQRVGQGNQRLTHRECRFCHVETASATLEQELNANGYYIYEMDGCPDR